jgi:hypothetical protein
MEPRVHRKWSLDLSLRTKLTALTGVLMVAVTIFVVTYFPNRMDDQGRSWMLRHADGVALILANAVAPGLEFNDRKGVESQLGLLINSPEVSYVVVLNSNGETFAIWKKEGVPPDLRTVKAPVVEETDEYLHLARPIVAPAVRPERSLSGCRSITSSRSATRIDRPSSSSPSDCSCSDSPLPSPWAHSSRARSTS